MSTETLEHKQIEEVFDALEEMNNIIYTNNPVGGPLHIVLDDFNFEDDSLEWCEKWMNSDTHQTHSDAIKIVAHAMIALFRKLTLAQRWIWHTRYDITDPVQEALDKRDWTLVTDEQCNSTLEKPNEST